MKKILNIQLKYFDCHYCSLIVYNIYHGEIYDQNHEILQMANDQLICNFDKIKNLISIKSQFCVSMQLRPNPAEIKYCSFSIFVV